MDLLSARRESHQTRNGINYDIRFGNDGVFVEPNDAFNNMMGGMTAPEQTGKDLFGFTGADVANTAKAAGRAVAGGVQDAALGVVDLADDIVNFLNTNIEPTLNFKRRPEGYQPPEGEVNMKELIDTSLQELGLKVPQGNSPIEAMARGLVQFGAGMAVAPIRGVGFANTMLRGGFADALFDPEEGNLSTLLKDFGLEGAVLDFLDSKVDEEASAEERLTARLKQTLEGAGISLPIDFIVQGFKALRSEEGAVEIIRNKLVTAGDAAEARIADRAGETTLYSGVDPTVPVDKALVAARNALLTREEIAPEPVKIDTDEAVNVLNLRAEQMKLAPKDRVQPSGEVMFETTPDAYARTFPEQKETPVPRAPEGKTLPLGDRARKVIEMSEAISNKLAERAKPFVGTNVQFFYNTGPIVDKAIELGYTKEQAFEALRKFALNYAATSPRTKTEENLRSASLASVKQEKGIDIGTIIGPGGEGINEKGYPMIINPGGLHRKLLDDVMASGISFDTNPKPATFAENVAGNLSGVTVDTHAIRAVLDALNEIEPGSVPLKFIGGKTPAKTKEYQEMYQKDPSTFDAATMVADTLGSQKIDGKDVQTEYAVFSDIYKQVAEKLGVKPAEAQSLSWFANGNKTGLASEPKTIVELIDDRVDVTSQLTGMSKDEVFKKFFKGSIPLLSVGGGLTLLETGSSMSEQNQQEGI